MVKKVYDELLQRSPLLACDVLVGQVHLQVAFSGCGMRLQRHQELLLDTILGYDRCHGRDCVAFVLRTRKHLRRLQHLTPDWPRCTEQINACVLPQQSLDILQ